MEDEFMSDKYDFLMNRFTIAWQRIISASEKINNTKFFILELFYFESKLISS